MIGKTVLLQELHLLLFKICLMVKFLHFQYINLQKEMELILKILTHIMMSMKKKC